MCGLTYDFHSEMWKLRHPNGSFVVFDRYMVEDLSTETRLLTFPEANNLVWQVFRTSLENLMGPYEEVVTAKEGWDGGWAPSPVGSLPVPRSPTPPPPPKPQEPKSIGGGFGPVSARKRAKVRKQLQSLQEETCQSCHI